MLFGRTVCQITEQLRHKAGNPLTFVFGLSLFYCYHVFLMLQKNIIMIQDQINCLNNTKEGLASVAW